MSSLVTSFEHKNFCKLCKLLLQGMVLCLLLVSISASAKPAIRLGVLAFRPDATDQAKWRPFADYLETHLKRRVELSTYDFPDMERAAQQGKLDILIANPSFLILMRSRIKMSAPVATLIRLEGEEKLKSFGGVIVARRGSAEISSLADLTGKRIAAVSTSSFGGYQMQAAEMLDAGLAQPSRTKLLITGMPHDRAIKAVLAGKADAGFVRGGVIEEMVRDGHLKLDSLKVINRRHLPDYPYISSTKVYPEWPVMVMPHVNDETKSQIAIAIFSLKHDSTAAKVAGIHGFTVPAEYRVVDSLLQRLRLPPYDKTPEFTLKDVWKKHALTVLLLAAILILMAFFSLLMCHLNRRLLQKRRAFQAVSEDLELVLSAMPDLLFEVGKDGHCYRIWASQADKLPGRKAEAAGKNLSEIFPQHATSVCMQALRQAGEHGVSIGHQFELELGLQRVWFELSISRKKTADIDGQHFLMLSRDITERKRIQEQLERVAKHDDLTGIFNRRHFMELANSEYKKAFRLQQNLSVALIDIDYFKGINDTHGHASGDKVLKALAQTIQKNIREIDVFARLGGR